MEGLHANLGLTIVVGLVCAIPTVIIAGPVYGRWIAPRLDVNPDQELVAQFTGGTTAADAAGRPTAARAAGRGRCPPGGRWPPYSSRSR
ncbi:hypothetical protein NKH77_49420 [Streptomyces sp. M19]